MYWRNINSRSADSTVTLRGWTDWWADCENWRCVVKEGWENRTSPLTDSSHNSQNPDRWTQCWLNSYSARHNVLEQSNWLCRWGGEDLHWPVDHVHTKQVAVIQPVTNALPSYKTLRVECLHACWHQSTWTWVWWSTCSIYWQTPGTRKYAHI